MRFYEITIKEYGHTGTNGEPAMDDVVLLIGPGSKVHLTIRDLVFNAQHSQQEATHES